MTTPPTAFHAPTRVLMGEGALAQLGQELHQLGVARPMLAYGETIAQTPHVSALRELLEASGLPCQAAYRTVEPDPSVRTVEAGAAQARDAGADVLIAIGGGSSMDAAKAMAVMATNAGSIPDFEGPKAYANEPLPVVCLTTTAGTASEVTPFAVITDTERDYKFVVVSPKIHPRLALLVPSLCATAPTSAVVAAGMDALTHAAESYLAKSAGVHSRCLALRAIELIGDNLPKVAADPGNAEAMMNMLIAANLAGLAFSNTRLGIVHAMALPPGARFGSAHGATNAVLLPFGLEFNAIAAQELMADIAVALGADVEDLPLREQAQLAAEEVRLLAEDIGAPRRLSEFGVEAEQIPAMAEDAMKSGHIAVNPRRVTLDDIIHLYQRAL